MSLVENLMQAAERGHDASPAERAEMLMEMAMGLQRRPKTPEHLAGAVRLYDAALAACPPEEPLLAARIVARKATALLAIPGEGSDSIEAARSLLEQCVPELARRGGPAELAEAEMNLGLCLQHLGRLREAIAAYQRALRTFTARSYPAEFAILQNNLATAFLATRSPLSEALAVQSFEQALKAVNLIEHPAEYAMLQNNLGNALQSVASSHALENHLRALAAYEEALKVRTASARPLEHANTLANQASCLRTLGRVEEARACYERAREIFASHGETAKARAVDEALQAG